MFLLAGLLAGVALVGPDLAMGHGGTVGRQDLPLPQWLFGWGAAAVLILSFVGLAVLWPTPQLEKAGELALDDAGLRTPLRILDALCGLVGAGLFALVIYAGSAGSQEAANNFANPFVYFVFWVGLVPLSVLFGDVYRAFSPFRAIGRAAAWAGGRLAPGGLPDPLAYPERLGHWPAAAGLLAFGWLELVSADRDDPSAVATLALVYGAVQLVGMSLYGVEAWTRNGDGFGVYYGALARLSPVRWSRDAVFLRRPLAGLTKLDPLPGTVAVFVVLIGVTSFDGFTAGSTWNDHLGPTLTDFWRDAMGMNPADALQAARTVGLLAGPLLILGLYRLGATGVRWATEQRDARAYMRAFAHSLVPIAMAYAFAHYFSALSYSVQQMIYLASDPLGDGSDIFGTASHTVDYGWISSNGVSYVQFASLLVGHVAGLVLAHERALVLFKDDRFAMRSQYWMLFIMLVLTLFGLWLLFEANA